MFIRVQSRSDSCGVFDKVIFVLIVIIAVVHRDQGRQPDDDGKVQFVQTNNSMNSMNGIKIRLEKKKCKALLSKQLVI